MSQVLVVSAEPRLVEAVQSNLDEGASVHTVERAEDAKLAMLRESFAFVCIDYESVRGESWETFVGFDNVLRMEEGFAALLVRAPDAEAEALTDQLESLVTVIDLSRGRPQFDDKIKLLYERARKAHEAGKADISTDRIIRHEVDLPAIQSGNLVETPLARVLYTIQQRKEEGQLRLQYSSHELSFGTTGGDVVCGGEFDRRKDLLGAFSWSHGKYEFQRGGVTGKPTSLLQVIAEGCRDHIRQRAITEVMTPVMRRYPVLTNLWEERSDKFSDFTVLQTLLVSLDGETNWENALSALGQKVTDGFRAAYFAIQTDLVHTVETPGFIGVAIQYSREVLRAREEFNRAQVEKTKAFRAASDDGASELQRELGVMLAQMRDMTPHEVFDVWEGCGRQVVQDRFYILVKEHHPDAYGGNTSSEVRSLAQDIFIIVKESYQKLLSLEKQQTVEPPPEFLDEDSAVLDEGSAPRERLDTPRFDGGDSGGHGGRSDTPPPGPHRSNSAHGRGASTSGGARKNSTAGGRTSSAGGRRASRAGRSATAPGQDPGQPAEEAKPKVDVKKKLSMLSGFRKKQKHLERRAQYQSTAKAESEAEEESDPQQLSENSVGGQRSEPAPEPEPEEPSPQETEKQRRAKLDHLLKRAQKAGHPDANPARDYWSKGYKLFKDGDEQDAFEHFERAYELEPESGPNITFYAYTGFLKGEHTGKEAQALLREALETGDRQSAPDACLFLGHTYKAEGKVEDAVKYYKRALRLNPHSRQAQREVRLAEKRDGGGGQSSSSPGNFLKKLFKK